MTSLYDQLQPLVLEINLEGGNHSSFHLSRPVLEAIDSGAPTDRSLEAIRAKILEKVAAYGGKRDHLGFNQIFEAYSEGVIYLVAGHRRKLALQAIDDGAKHGKTPDFMTLGEPAVGLEVKTINVVDPERTIDAAMDEGFERGYEAEQESMAEAHRTGGVGIGFAVGSFAPHGEGVAPKGAVEQTIKKIRNNVKTGQYTARPTLLVVSMVRLGLDQRAVDLRRRLDVDEDCGIAPSGHLYAVAANRLQDPFYGYSHKWYGVRDAGPLSEAGILRDHDEIAGVVFLQTEWNKSGDPDAIETGFRFNGIWNAGWDPENRFSREQKVAAKRVFEQLCDAWNDTEDSRASLIPDLNALHDAFRNLVGDFIQKWRRKTPDAAALAGFMAEADRAYFTWRAAVAGIIDAAENYTVPGPDDIHTGHLEGTDTPVIFVSLAPAAPGIPRLNLLGRNGSWREHEDLGAITGGEIVV